MPRVVRNFWASVQTDGRSTMATGPASKDGGMAVTIAQRMGCDIVHDAVQVECFACRDGSLKTRVTVKGHQPVEYITTR